MLQRIRVAAVALTMAAGVLALTPPASAAAAPDISEVTLNPVSPIVVFDKPVPVTFSFATKDAESATLKIRPGGQVAVDTFVPLKALKSGPWTRWTGTHAFDAGAAGQWSFVANAHGAGDKARNGAFEVKKALTTRIVRFDANPDLVGRGDEIKLSGQLQADGNGYGGQQVTIAFRARGADDYRPVTKVTTGGNGWFSVNAKAFTTGSWRAEFAGNAAARSSVSDSDGVDVRSSRRQNSEITDFSASPARVDKGDEIGFSGRLRTENGRSAAGQKITIVFKADGSRRWVPVTSDETSRRGRFEASATAAATGQWRAVFAGARGIRGSVSDTERVQVDQPAEKADSRIIRFNASPEPVRRGHDLRFSGRLLVDEDGSWEGHAAEVGLFFRAAGSDEWVFVKSADSGDSGRLFTRAKVFRSGSWRFVFAGDDDFNGDTSRRDFVSVRH
jgi:hypothetical protein